MTVIQPRPELNLAKLVKILVRLDYECGTP